MKVEKEVWQERMNNLMLRRQNNTSSSQADTKVSDYGSHVNKVFIGGSVLDVGCGSMALKSFILDKGARYKGMDAFPLTEEVYRSTIEECDYLDNSFDTVFVFAALDNFQDLEKAFFNLKRIAHNNVVFLTGVDIEPDKYHTHKITKELLIDGMVPFKIGYYEELAPKVILIEFIK